MGAADPQPSLFLHFQTIVGSEIFNQLVICAGAVFASKSGYLQLERTVVTREIFFYALSIGLLLFALHDIEPTEDDEEDHIFISFTDACVLFSGYIVYVLVCANFDSIVKCFSRRQPDELASVGERVKRKQFDKLDDLPFVKTGTGDHPETREFFITKGGERHSGDESQDLMAEESSRHSLYGATSSSSIGRNTSRRASLERSMHYAFGRFSEGDSLRMFRFFIQDEKPSDNHELYDIQINTVSDALLGSGCRAYFARFD